MKKIFLGVLRGFFSIFLIISAVFFVVGVLPGDPARIIAGEFATDEEVKNIRKNFGLDKPLYIRYFDTIKGIFTFDFGKSFYLGENVSTLILKHFKNTILLSITTISFSIPLSLLFFFLLKRWEFIIPMMMIYSVPNFVIGIVLIIIFSVKLKIFPVSGFQGFDNLVLPAFTLSLSQAVVLGRFMRSFVDLFIGSDYFTFLRAKGIPKKLIFYHTIRYVLPSLLQVFSLQVGVLLTGTVITEYLFSFPGIGYLIVSSVSRRDFPVIFGGVFIFSIVWFLVNFFADLVISILDPRTRQKTEL